ncbi:hypothetical protein GCM10011312_25150 [Planktosalinus lacus]|uniref:Uncharacterized protein n=1 Tax=Planktosalinus lacus TaxID=1526573 RepID=A0A8J2VCP3_9FLAO|nr:hypothetical protein GCM10011312_25150 [Planktosalinus lacus]
MDELKINNEELKMVNLYQGRQSVLILNTILDFGIWILEFGFWNLEFGIWYLDFGIWNFVRP